MKKTPSLAALILASVVGAWSADVIVERAPLHFGAPASPGWDATLELKWDSGTTKYWGAWYTGAGSWVGNDFDIGTVGAYCYVKALRFMTCVEWPNPRWEGFRVGIYLFSGVPGELLWPTAGGGYFFKPTGPTGWKDVPVDWKLPSGVTRFVGAVEQYYDYRDCDPFFIDDNPTFMGHSWQYYRGRWSLFSAVQYLPYRNVMIRVVVEDTVAITPTSIGRVKALYY